MIKAGVSGGGMEKDIVGCFDPTMFRARGGHEGAIRIAENDARRRGPCWGFRVRTGTELIRGHAERYHVSISSESVIPEPLRSRFLVFLESLQFAPFVTVSSFRLEGNDKFPA
jgi:hypothetical protein